MAAILQYIQQYCWLFNAADLAILFIFTNSDPLGPVCLLVTMSMHIYLSPSHVLVPREQSRFQRSKAGPMGAAVMSPIAASIPWKNVNHYDWQSHIVASVHWSVTLWHQYPKKMYHHYDWQTPIVASVPWRKVPFLWRCRPIQLVLVLFFCSG